MLKQLIRLCCAGSLLFPASIFAAPTSQPASRPASRPAEAIAPTSQTAAEASDFANQFAAPIEAAHHADQWRAHDSLSTNITVSFGGQIQLEGKLIMRTDMSRSRIELANGTVAGFDGENAWVSPGNAPLPAARFHVLTWPYFIAAPYKLLDPGTHLESVEVPAHNEMEYDAAKLTFDRGIGDAPDDWYVIYRDQTDHHLHALAYIVTYSTSLEEAEAKPHAVVYTEPEEMDGVPIPTQWNFFNWDETNGINGDSIGEVVLDEISFIDADDRMYTMPNDARVAPKGE